MASFQYSTKVIFYAAKQLLIEIDYGIATEMNKFINEQLDKHKFFSGKRRYNSVEEMLKNDDCRIQFKYISNQYYQQRNNLIKIIVMCHSALQSHIDTVTVDADDLSTLGIFNKEENNQRLRKAFAWKNYV